MNEVKSVLIVGVGGQGTLLASRLLGNAMLRAGYDVKVSEVPARRFCSNLCALWQGSGFPHH